MRRRTFWYYHPAHKQLQRLVSEQLELVRDWEEYQMLQRMMARPLAAHLHCYSKPLDQYSQISNLLK